MFSVHPSLPVLKDNHCFHSYPSLHGQGLPPGAMQPLPKRPVLEKSNGAAATVFNPSMFHYQQALANMQLQQPAFIPTGESLETLAIHTPSNLESKKWPVHTNTKVENCRTKKLLCLFRASVLCDASLLFHCLLCCLIRIHSCLACDEAIESEDTA